MTFLMQAIQSFNHHSITTMSLHKIFCNFLFSLYADITLLCKVSFFLHTIVFRPSIVIFMDEKDEDENC